MKHPTGSCFHMAGFFISFVFTELFLWQTRTIAIDFIVTYRVGFLAAGVGGVAFYSVDGAVVDLFDDADVVGDAVLAAFFRVVPIEEDDVTWVGGIGIILPLLTSFKPILTNIADSEVG